MAYLISVENYFTPINVLGKINVQECLNYYLSFVLNRAFFRVVNNFLSLCFFEFLFNPERLIDSMSEQVMNFFIMRFCYLNGPAKFILHNDTLQIFLFYEILSLDLDT